MCDGGEDESDVWVFQWIKARKPRPCCACTHEIQRGEIYHRYKSLLDGSWWSYDHCATCWEICEALWAQNGGECIDLTLSCGEKWDDNFQPDEAVAGLAFELPHEAQARATKAYADPYERRNVAP